MGVIQFCPKIMTFWKTGLCLMLVIIGIISIRGSPIPEDDTEMSGDEGGSGNGNGSGEEDEPVAEAVRQENSEQGKNKKEPTMEEMMNALDDLEEGGSKGFRSLTAGQGPEADAVKQEDEDDVEGGDDEVEDEDVADDEGEGTDDEEQNYPEDEADEECDEEDCKEEPSQDKPEAES